MPTLKYKNETNPRLYGERWECHQNQHYNNSCTRLSVGVWRLGCGFFSLPKVQTHWSETSLEKRLPCTIRWVGLPRDIVSMDLSKVWGLLLQSQHPRQRISTLTASDPLKPTLFDPTAIESLAPVEAKQSNNTPTMSNAPTMKAMH